MFLTIFVCTVLLDLSLALCLEYLREADENPYAVRPGGWPQSFGQNYGVEALKLKAAAAADTGRVYLQRTPTSLTPQRNTGASSAGSVTEVDLFGFNKKLAELKSQGSKSVVKGAKKLEQSKIVRRSGYIGSPSTSKATSPATVGSMSRTQQNCKIPKLKQSTILASPSTSKGSDKEDVVEKEDSEGPGNSCEVSCIRCGEP